MKSRGSSRKLATCRPILWLKWCDLSETMDCRAEVAQLVEQRTENPCVGGSSPPLGTISLNVKSAPDTFLLRGRFAFDPHFDHHQLYRSRFHQMSEPSSGSPEPRRELLEDERAALLHAQVELDDDNPPEDIDLDRARRWVDQAAHAVEEALYELEPGRNERRRI